MLQTPTKSQPVRRCPRCRVRPAQRARGMDCAGRRVGSEADLERHRHGTCRVFSLLNCTPRDNPLAGQRAVLAVPTAAARRASISSEFICASRCPCGAALAALRAPSPGCPQVTGVVRVSIRVTGPHLNTMPAAPAAASPRASRALPVRRRAEHRASAVPRGHDPSVVCFIRIRPNQVEPKCKAGSPALACALCLRRSALASASAEPVGHSPGSPPAGHLPRDFLRPRAE